MKSGGSGLSTPKDFAITAMSASLSRAEVSLRRYDKSFRRLLSYKDGARVSQDDMVLAACVMMVDVASASGVMPERAYGMINRAVFAMFGTKTMLPALMIQYSQSVLADFRRTEDFVRLFSRQIPLEKRTALFDAMQNIAETFEADDPMSIYVVKRYEKSLVPETARCEVEA